MKKPESSSKLGRNPFGPKQPDPAPIPTPFIEPEAQQQTPAVRPGLEFLLVEAPARAVVLGVQLMGLAKAAGSTLRNIRKRRDA